MKSNAKVLLLIRHKGAEDDTFFNYHKANVSTDKQGRYSQKDGPSACVQLSEGRDPNHHY
jgi:hypothetical protein